MTQYAPDGSKRPWWWGGDIVLSKAWLALQALVYGGFLALYLPNLLTSETHPTFGLLAGALWVLVTCGLVAAIVATRRTLAREAAAPPAPGDNAAA